MNPLIWSLNKCCGCQKATSLTLNAAFNSTSSRGEWAKRTKPAQALGVNAPFQEESPQIVSSYLLRMSRLFSPFAIGHWDHLGTLDTALSWASELYLATCKGLWKRSLLDVCKWIIQHEKWSRCCHTFVACAIMKGSMYWKLHRTNSMSSLTQRATFGLPWKIDLPNFGPFRFRSPSLQNCSLKYLGSAGHCQVYSSSNISKTSEGRTFARFYFTYTYIWKGVHRGHQSNKLLHPAYDWFLFCLTSVAFVDLLVREP